MRSEQLYQIDTVYYCAGLVVESRRVTQAAPVLRWALGKPWTEVERWARGKRARVTLVK
jgi:hypothetical protein